ncbi:MAG: UbiX family flavin prenyltransferase [Peptostreptococcaceae bacterium]
MNIVIAATGATGIIYTVRILEKLKEIEGINTHLIMSEWATVNLGIETSYDINYVESLADYVYSHKDLSAKVASGSFLMDGMIILPCSMKTLSSISNGYSDNLITRAADVTLKEGRKLVICPRETPLSPIHLENMLKLSRIGVSIMPPMPGFYSNPKTIDDIVNHHVMRVLDQFRINICNEKRWKGAEF